MTHEKDSLGKSSRLRTRAEKTLSRKPSDTEDVSSLSQEEVQRLVHELKIHQIELEMQNEDLRQAQVKLEELKDRYLDLYDFAPVGYVTLNGKGLILEANFTVVRLLGLERQRLTNIPFSRFVCKEFGDAYYLHLQKVLETQSKQTCEIELSREDGTQFYAQLESIAIQDENGQFNKCRTILSDITDRKKIEDAHLFLLQSNYNSDEDFFESLARYLAQSLGMFYVCIDRLLGDALTARTVAIYCDWKFEDNVEYALKDTPCGDVVGKQICCFPRDVRHLFPQDVALRDLMAESYVGTTLWSAKGQPIGLIAVIGRQPLADSYVAKSILKLVGIRAAGELERRIAEEELRKSEEKFRHLAENIQEVFWLTEPGKPKRVVYLSPAHEQIYGVRREHAYENPGTWLGSLHPEDRERVIRAYDEFLRGERDYSIEYRIVRPDGFTRWIWDRAFPVGDEQGNLVRVAGLGQDITERKKAEEALIDENDKAQKYLDVAGVIIVSLDRAGNVTLINRKGSELLGYLSNQIIGTRWFNTYLPESDREKASATFFKLMSGQIETAQYFENSVLTGRGEERLIAWYNTVLKDEGGTIIGTLSSGEDITERKKAEVALRDAKNNLEVRVKERTAELAKTNIELEREIDKRAKTETILKDTLVDLTRSNQDLQQFAHVAYHDLQEPLHTVVQALQMLEKKDKGNLTQGSAQLIGFAVDGAKKMKALIQDLLTYSSLNARMKPPEIVDMEAVLTQSILNLESLREGKEVKISYDEMPTVKGDSAQLMHVFENLIGNAVKFGPTESPVVHVSAQKNSNEWVFSVRDNGIGIEARHFDRIFVIFQQLSKKVPFHGTGMGLAIVKKIVERHRGRVWVESEVGVGSTFYFTIPDGSES